ncbi:hypothetical protein GLUCORHAEAF1_01240 [Komagataeibacter rhaeticus AF1]|uniref:IS66 family transposase n=1 Tax=Komagataeibacter rhaeticus TaxID=215221 RepID=UPI0004D82B7A|nr:IS66 family transposase zinc-finger binding domain-containing protein [Komagataeibacter rhaeticus]KDU96539.1 hypothetical protein GLUCORHAEAF1_01240 [Komagataeibacter rhaeticus AF1]
MTGDTDDIIALRAALAAAEARAEVAEARAASAEAQIAHLKHLIARMRQDRFGASSERGRRLLAQLELELEELETTLAEDAPENAVNPAVRATAPRSNRGRQPLRADLPRERVVIPAPTQCPCCGSDRLSKLGESVTETLEVIPRQFKMGWTASMRHQCAMLGSE